MSYDGTYEDLFFYVEHLIFAVHVHAFMFCLCLVGLWMPHAFLVLAPVGLLYLVVALRRFSLYEAQPASKRVTLKVLGGGGEPRWQ